MFPGGEKLVLGLGVQSTGQAHATVFPRLVAQKLGIPPQQIQHRHGDTAYGHPGHALGRVALGDDGGHRHRAKPSRRCWTKGKGLAAGMLEAADADVAYRDGMFEVVGTDRRISLFEVADRAAEAAKRGGNRRDARYQARRSTRRRRFPMASTSPRWRSIPATGMVTSSPTRRWTIAAPCSIIRSSRARCTARWRRVWGRRCKEVAAYDPSSGQLVTGSFMDYAMPRAEDMPPIRDALHPVPATTNPLGVKGVGEAGTTASIAAVMNAIADAIPGEAGARLDMPATPEKVWQACRDGATYRLV